MAGMSEATKYSPSPSPITTGGPMRADMSGQAGMTHAISALDRLEPKHLFEIAQLAFSAANLQLVMFIDDSNSRGIIAAILQFAQAVNDERHYLFFSNVADNSTHMVS